MMHFYVFWRLSSVPWVTAQISGRTLFITASKGFYAIKLRVKGANAAK